MAINTAVLSLVIVTTLMGSGIHGALEIPVDFEEKVASLVNIFLESNTAPGVGLTVVTSDGLLDFSRGYGLADIEGNVPVTEKSLFCIASISKSFAATIVSKVLNEKFGNLDSSLEASIVQLAPSLNFSLSDRVRAESTNFRDLLSHRSCLSTSTLGRTVGAFSTVEEFIYRTRYAPQICPFRTGYHYNNNMFALAGETIAKIAGANNYDELLSSFLKELGMVNSKVINKEENYGSLPNMAQPYYLDLDKKLTHMNPDLLRRSFISLGSGGVVTSPEDMKNYLLFHLNEGRVGDVQVVPAAAVRRIKRPTNPFDFKGFGSDTSDSVNGDFAYALGLNIGFFEGQQLISHDGFWAPYPSRMSLYPSLGLGIYSSANGPGRLQGQSFTTLHNAITSLLLGSKSFEEIKAEFVKKVRKTKKIVPASDLKSKVGQKQKFIRVEPVDAAGSYGNPFHGELEIVYNSSDNTLSLLYGLWGRGIIRPSETDESFFELEFTGDVIADILSQSDSISAIPLRFVDADTFILNYGDDIEFKRDATLSSFPDIPYPPDSCSP